MTRIRIVPAFKFGNMDMDPGEDYCIYLGICFNWNVFLKRCCTVKLQRLCNAFTHIKSRKLNISTGVWLKLFNRCIKPILLYGCEVWGYDNVEILENVHTKFCKFIYCWRVQMFS